MPAGDRPDDEPIKEAKKLAAGLKSCRAVMENYRSLLGSDAHEPDPAEREHDERTDGALEEHFAEQQNVPSD